jgi:hypothetical protein
VLPARACGEDVGLGVGTAEGDGDGDVERVAFGVGFGVDLGASCGGAASRWTEADVRAGCGVVRCVEVGAAGVAAVGVGDGVAGPPASA